ncbi:hypothetical protein V1264_005455 [Littorina saxatilis]|uniref:Uncharacterized protein n=1 Tax=Littorina saxatilis TaxID=31220 RepID=A0AAN9AZA8_9CAEN
MKVEGKGAFLTGGATGIGRGVLQALLERGARVSVSDWRCYRHRTRGASSSAGKRGKGECFWLAVLPA